MTFAFARPRAGAVGAARFPCRALVRGGEARGHGAVGSAQFPPRVLTRGGGLRPGGVARPSSRGHSAVSRAVVTQRRPATLSDH